MARVDRHNTTRYWNATGVDGLSCLHADFTTHDYAPHQHDAFVVAVTESGGSEFRSRGRSDEARESVLLVFNPAEPHSGRMGWSKRWRYRSLYLTQPAIDHVTAGLGIDRPAYFMRNVLGDADLIAAFARLHRSLDEGHDPLEEHELLVASFGELFTRHGDGARAIPTVPRDEAAVSIVVKRMASQLAERFDAAQISCCLSVDGIGDGKIRATRALEKGREVVEATLPCLITVEKDNFFGRLPNLEAYLAAKRAEITSIRKTTSTGSTCGRSACPAPGRSSRRSTRPSCPSRGRSSAPAAPARTSAGSWSC